MASELYNQLLEESISYGESNDCTVKMVAASMGVSYKAAHAYVKKCGRRFGGGYFTDVIIRQLRKDGAKIEDATEFVRERAKTVKSMSKVKIFKLYNLIVRTSGHVLSVNEGEVHDNSEGRQYRVIQAWVVNKLPDNLDWEEPEVLRESGSRAESYRYAYVYNGKILKRFKRRPRCPKNLEIVGKPESFGKIKIKTI